MKFAIGSVLLACALLMAGQSSDSSEPNPKFSELVQEDIARLDRQRKLIAAVVRQGYAATALTKTTKDLPVLQKLLDDKVFDKSQAFELQSLGVAFGDVLTAEFPLHWGMITDEYGTDPTLRLKGTSVNINALTMISKRVERG